MVLGLSTRKSVGKVFMFQFGCSACSNELLQPLKELLLRICIDSSVTT
jgi:hypothetical protein